MDQQLKLLLTGIMQPTWRMFREECRKASPKTKLTFPQFRILNGIRRGRNQVGVLAEHHSISQPAMSKMVGSLVNAGLVRRSPHPTDRRQIELSLTPKAQSLVDMVEENVVERIRRKVNRLSAADQKTVRDGIDKISAVLAQQEEP